MKKSNRYDTQRQLVSNYQAVLRDYENLSRQPVLSEIAAKRLEHILEIAYDDSTLSLLLNEIDDAIAQEQGLNYHHLNNQMARVFELIDGDIPIHRAMFERAKLNLAAYEPILDEYYQLLKVSTLSDIEAARMGQILDAAYEDELFALLLDSVNDRVGAECRDEQSNSLQVEKIFNAIKIYGRPTEKSKVNRRKTLMCPALMACSMLLVTGPLIFNLCLHSSRALSEDNLSVQTNQQYFYDEVFSDLEISIADETMKSLSTFRLTDPFSLEDSLSKSSVMSEYSLEIELLLSDRERIVFSADSYETNTFNILNNIGQDVAYISVDFSQINSDWRETSFNFTEDMASNVSLTESMASNVSSDLLDPTGNVIPIPPTPALLPGLIGMGVAVIRKRKQAAEPEM